MPLPAIAALAARAIPAIASRAAVSGAAAETSVEVAEFAKAMKRIAADRRRNQQRIAKLILEETRRLVLRASPSPDTSRYSTGEFISGWRFRSRISGNDLTVEAYQSTARGKKLLKGLMYGIPPHKIFPKRRTAMKFEKTSGTVSLRTGAEKKSTLYVRGSVNHPGVKYNRKLRGLPRVVQRHALDIAQREDQKLSKEAVASVL